ncbi:MAG: DegT/DnrJ/EryC1/StrS aminotransferase family protein [Rickettsiales bacterium]|nr:DegT/DnrJ/EryC1/StrS aminotransferase family protein [Rickettsiales bacterium]
MDSNWPYFTSDEVAVVKQILQSGKVNYWTGEHGKLFEKEYAKYLGTPYCIALSNGTVALEAALHALDIGKGDDIIIPARSFVATASCVALKGARPIFADVDLNSHNITVETISAVITPQTKAIIVVHLGGMPCDMNPIIEYAKEHNLKVIEDCAQAHGAFYKNKPVGSFGDAAAFSFCQDKIISTGGEGGMLVLKNKQAWKKAWSYKDHGKDFDLILKNNNNFDFKYVHQDFGTNWRMTEMQAAIGRLQLKKLSNWVGLRRRNAMILDQFFSKTPLFETINIYEDCYNSYYRYYVLINSDLLSKDWNRNKLIKLFNEHDIQCNVGSCPEIYLERAFVNAGFSPRKRLPNAKKIGETCIAFFVHPTLTEEHMCIICKKIEKALDILHEKTS